MSTPAASPELNVPPPQQSPVMRVVNVFVSPTKAFVGLERNASSWWLPFLLLIVVSYAYVGLMDKKIGFDKVSENQIKLNQKAVERLDKLSPEQRQQQMDLSAKITKYVSYGTPVLALIAFAVIAMVLLATFNFGMGASIKYSTIFAMTIFAHLPNVLKTVFICIAIAAGLDPDGFDVRNPIATNLGALVGHSSPVLNAVGSWVDIFTIWICILTGIGIASVSKVKRGTAIGVIFGWWVFLVLLSAGWTALFG